MRARGREKEERERGIARGRNMEIAMITCKLYIKLYDH